MTSKPTLITYVALLRGINVGGNNKVSMAALKKIFQSLGYKSVSTYINSGNVIFRTEEEDVLTIANAIETRLAHDLGFPVRVTIRSVKQMHAVCRAVPDEWTNDDVMRTDVLFLWKEVDNAKDIKSVLVDPRADRIIHKAGVLVWNMLRKDYPNSKMRAFIGTRVYKHMTARNVNTTRKLLELMEKAGETIVVA